MFGFELYRPHDNTHSFHGDNFYGRAPFCGGERHRVARLAGRGLGLSLGRARTARAGEQCTVLAYGAMVFNGMGPRNHLFEASMAGARDVLAWIAGQDDSGTIDAVGICGPTISAAHPDSNARAGKSMSEDPGNHLRERPEAGRPD